jgi:hypothetical protein
MRKLTPVALTLSAVVAGTVLFTLGAWYGAPRLSMVGWYLMSPPVRNAPQAPSVDWNAPIGDWGIHASYDTAQECEKDRRQMMKESTAWLESSTPGPTPNPLRPTLREEMRSESSLTCIATSDPRLTGR